MSFLDEELFWGMNLMLSLLNIVSKRAPVSLLSKLPKVLYSGMTRLNDMRFASLHYAVWTGTMGSLQCEAAVLFLRRFYRNLRNFALHSIIAQLIDSPWLKKGRFYSRHGHLRLRSRLIVFTLLPWC